VVGDWDHPYSTMAFRAEATIAREIMKFAENGLLYRGSKPVMWSVVEKTALAEAEVEYQDYQSDMIWVKFPVTAIGGSGDQEELIETLIDSSVVIWTTTPWTIPGNRAISFSSKIAYGIYEITAAPEGNWAAVGERLILADKLDARKAALAKLLPMQRQDFIEIFEIMAGLPVTIRLLDPPLHEFLPHADHEIEEVADEMNANPDILRSRVAELDEFNPMLGHRGVRLLITYPEIAEMQTRAIFEAATEVARKSGKAPIPEVMVPLVASKAELDTVCQRIVKVAEDVARETGVAIAYQVGTMIELPRAALRAGEIAESAEFFSFGTNDLTQTTFGISRDDAARFIGEYTAKGIFKADPFMTLDIEGVGELVSMAAERGRKVRPDIKLGICGEHGGDPASIAFCEKTGLDYVSCSPFRVPIARLAAAQASLEKT